MPGTLFFVVGASGVGKDTLIRGAREALSSDDRFVFARRTITRPPDVGDEGHEHVSGPEFEKLRAGGRFLIAWAAHDLLYGIRSEYRRPLMSGKNVVVNGSRAAIPNLLRVVPDAIVVQITVSPAIVAQRLAARGREDESQIQARLERGALAIPHGAKIVTLANDSDEASGVAAFTSILRQHACPTAI